MCISRKVTTLAEILRFHFLTLSMYVCTPLFSLDSHICCCCSAWRLYEMISTIKKMNVCVHDIFSISYFVSLYHRIIRLPVSSKNNPDLHFMNVSLHSLGAIVSRDVYQDLRSRNLYYYAWQKVNVYSRKVS